MSLHEQLRELADAVRVLPGDRAMLIEAADRLELVEGLYEDQVEITRNWRLAAEARWDRIKRLEEAGDGLSMWVCPEYKSDPANIALQNWRKAKEANP